MENIRRCCLACDYQIKTYISPEEEYQEVTVCPKCNGAFVDMWKLGKYKQSNKNVEPLLQIVQSDIDAVPVVLYKGEEIKGKVRVSFDWKTDEQHHKSGPYVHIEHVEYSAKCVNTRIIQRNHPIAEEVLSKFSTEELVEALKLKEDVQIADTSEDTYKVSMDLMKVKKHVLVINNCNPQLVEHRRRVLDAEMIRFAGSCCD